uniref:Uncharacterized protein n=1 Tax=Leptocylindrus danicus TaxID=163516 RepID=A0A7S2JYE7_9STRA
MRVLLPLCATLSSTAAFTASEIRTNRDVVTSRSLATKSDEASVSIERRDFFGITAAAAASTFLIPTQAANAAGAPSAEDLQRIRTGYNGITYLLENFEKETTVCRENGGECKRDAEPVRRYMGLRSTTDPLFQIEKVFAKVKNMDLDIDKLETFFEATEEWNTAVNMSNSMAFISQFGEYNPGGGKDEVLKYLNEAKKQVELAEGALSKIMDCLDMKP